MFPTREKISHIKRTSRNSQQVYPIKKTQANEIFFLYNSLGKCPASQSFRAEKVLIVLLVPGQWCRYCREVDRTFWGVHF